MEHWPAPPRRAERIIALARAFLAAATLLAIWLDPVEPAKLAPLTYTLLAGYVGYALLVLALVSRPAAPVAVLAPWTHALDLILISILLYLTDAPTSPFFVYFVFALLAAALRWQWQGVLVTGAVTLGIFLTLGLGAPLPSGEPRFELDRFIIRSVHLALVAVLLGVLVGFEQQLRRELGKLAAWPREARDADPVERALHRAADALDAPRAAMVWEEVEEPWRHRARLDAGEVTRTREPAGAGATPVAAALEETDFLCTDLAASQPSTLYFASGRLARHHGPPLDPELRRTLGATGVLALRLRGIAFYGHLLLLDKPWLSADDLMLGRIVARQVAADLDQLLVQERLRHAAAAEERVALARELHDGVLQALTGLALQLQALRRLLETSPAAAHARLAEIQDLLAAEQAELRTFLRRLRPSAALAEPAVEPAVGLRDLALDPQPRPLPEPLCHAVQRIVEEAITNAGRHAGGTTVRVRIAAGGDRVRITVADNGCGFPVHGRHDLAALDALGQGPASLMERVRALGGELVVDTGSGGTRLEVTLPLAAPGRDAATEPSYAHPGARR
jgi:signal transduction histidine kinase